MGTIRNFNTIGLTSRWKGECDACVELHWPFHCINVDCVDQRGCAVTFPFSFMLGQSSNDNRNRNDDSWYNMSFVQHYVINQFS